jgi:catechol 2,3-dioxygenase-like lactoylglutathione lyase family enzyme
MIQTEGITHVHIVVRDLERSLRFYEQVFGMRELFREGPGLVFLRTPGAADTLTLNEDPSLRDHAGETGGFQHFGFRLLDKADLDRAVEEVEEAGGRLLRRGEHEPGHPFAYVTDPDGYTLEL